MAQTTFKLAEYQEPNFWLKTVDLDFVLDPSATIVRSRMVFEPNSNRDDGPHDLILDGEKLKLISAAINGVPLAPEAMQVKKDHLIVASEHVPQEGFTWEAEVEINPKKNTALEGLYMSNGMYCTQCEAEGFRKITYSLDRPDVMAEYRVTINSSLPVLLSNGNKIADGQWHDPWPKPSYLFALVAGDLVSFDDRFTTMSGRDVELKIWVRDGDLHKCAYAMDALKRSMRWDEEVYGREYDLDIFQIVAVDDFNMGAMENKGLNIFNSKYVLASADTATDRDYELIEAIIAHEYFHNWTGNRITCRDWFQLSLKEGLTVFRDQEFSADMRSRAVKRIDDVQMLRARQFREDAGPLSHPVRPEEYAEINNFYTATVYDKGAELIRMLRGYVGEAIYDKALDLYFKRHDGQACTVEDWLRVFEDASRKNLDRFKLWYQQSGTPHVRIQEVYKDRKYSLIVSQDDPAGPNREGKQPQVIPIKIGLLDQEGKQLGDDQVLTLSEAREEFSLGHWSQKPTLSALREFSAPIILEQERTDETRAFLLAHDSDAFVRWEAGRELAFSNITAMIGGTGHDLSLHLDALFALLDDKEIDPSFMAMLLKLPSEDEIAAHLHGLDLAIDPAKILDARADYLQAMARAFQPKLTRIYQANTVGGVYSPDAKSAARRSLRAAVLGLITKLDNGALAGSQFDFATNMTDRWAALSALTANGHGRAELKKTYDAWKHDAQVLDKWFALQIAHVEPNQALALATKLTGMVEFKIKNPNRFRAVMGAFTANHGAFHKADGTGYQFVIDWLSKLDKINPQTTARMLGAFETWTRYPSAQREAAKSALTTFSGIKGLSSDSKEIVGKLLAM